MTNPPVDRLRTASDIGDARQGSLKRRCHQPSGSDRAILIVAAVIFTAGFVSVAAYLAWVGLS